MAQQLSKTIEEMVGLPLAHPPQKHVLTLQDVYRAHRCRIDRCSKAVWAPVLRMSEAEGIVQGGACLDASHQGVRVQSCPSNKGRHPPGGKKGSALEGETGGKSLALLRWEKALATKVWLCPDAYEREAFALLASAVWEMTHYGFSYAAAQCGVRKEKARQKSLLLGKQQGKKVRGQAHKSASHSGVGSCCDSTFLAGAAQGEYWASEQAAWLNHNARIRLMKSMIDAGIYLERK